MQLINIFWTLSALNWAHAYKIEIDLGDAVLALPGDQIRVSNEATRHLDLNATMVPKGDLTLDPFGCPGACPGTATCTAGHGSIRIANQGTPFYLYCNRYITGPDNGGYSQTTEQSFEACTESCAAEPWCFGSSYSAATKQCRRHSNIDYPVGEDTNWQSALKMAPSLAIPVRCPKDDGRLVKTGFRTYKAYCGYNIAGKDLPPSIRLASYESCAQQCDNRVGCAAFTYINSTSTCYFKSEYAVPPNQPTEKTDDTTALLVPQTSITKPPCCAAQKN